MGGRRYRNNFKLEDVRLHDLRHSFASFAVSAGISLAIISGLLGYRSAQNTARYAHLANDPLKQATDIVGGLFAAKPKARDNAGSPDGSGRIYYNSWVI